MQNLNASFLTHCTSKHQTSKFKTSNFYLLHKNFQKIFLKNFSQISKEPSHCIPLMTLRNKKFRDNITSSKDHERNKTEICSENF